MSRLISLQEFTLYGRVGKLTARIVDLIRIASRHEGYAYGNFIRQVVIPLLNTQIVKVDDSTLPNPKFGDLELWFTDSSKATNFTKDLDKLAYYDSFDKNTCTYRPFRYPFRQLDVEVNIFVNIAEFCPKVEGVETLLYDGQNIGYVLDSGCSIARGVFEAAKYQAAKTEASKMSKPQPQPQPSKVDQSVQNFPALISFSFLSNDRQMFDEVFRRYKATDTKIDRNLLSQCELILSGLMTKPYTIPLSVSDENLKLLLKECLNDPEKIRYRILAEILIKLNR